MLSHCFESQQLFGSISNCLFWIKRSAISTNVDEIIFCSRVREFLSVDIDISGLEVNQCDPSPHSNENEILSNQIASFKGTHKCHTDTTQVILLKLKLSKKNYYLLKILSFNFKNLSLPWFLVWISKSEQSYKSKWRWCWLGKGCIYM